MSVVRSFPETSWTQVGKAACEQTGHAALNDLCEQYWYPLYAFLRADGESPEDAADLTQGFLHELIENNTLASADRAKGKLRSFLIAALKNHRNRHYRNQNAQKRGGGVTHVSIDSGWAESRFIEEIPDRAATPELSFDRRWALMYFEFCLGKLEQEYAGRGKADEFEVLYQCLNPSNEIQIDTAAEKLAITSSNLRVKVHRLRQRLRTILETEAENGLRPEMGPEFIEELRKLFFFD